MKKIYLLLGFTSILGFAATAQTVEPELINFTQLAKFEQAHPELYKKCATCGERERDGGWRGLNEMPTPPGAIIKMQAQDQLRPAPHPPLINARPTAPNSPLTASPLPTANFLGYVDPGQGIPPDTHGAVGPNHVVTATNDFLIVHNKTTGAEISRVTITTFAGVPNTCDPYIKFDPASRRFFYSAIDCSGNNGNRVALLVSNSSDPTQGWFRYSFTPNAPSGSFFLDHPYMGFDGRWVVISGRKFPNGSFGGPILFIMDKQNILNNGAISFGTNAQLLEKTSADGDAPLPVTVYGTNPNPTSFNILQNWNGTNGQIRLSTVTGNIPNAVWNTTGSLVVFPTSPQTWTSATGNVAEQLGETRKLATNDARISAAVMVNGNIWCAHHVGVSASNVAIQWWQLNGTPGTAFGSVLQRGRIGAGLANNYRYFPAIEVNDNEDVIIGYTVSSNTSRVSAAYSFRSNITPLNTMDDEYIYKVGLSTYYKDFGGSRARWGDYSHSALDPSDGSLWTIQEYAAQRVGNTDNDSRYGVWWAQVTPASSLYQTDAGIGAIVEPVSGLLCNVPVVPKVTVRNFGSDTIRSVQIGMILDGTPLGTLNSISGLSIASFNSSATLSLTPGFSVGAGTHTFKAYTINPNNTNDLRHSNDTASVTFVVAPGLTLPYSESFQATVFPPANGSAVLNPDADVTWARTTTAGNPGNASMRINCYNYTTVGERDIYRTPKIDLSVLDSVELTFNVAYQQYFGTDVVTPPNDSLRILLSPDCGVTWIPTSYAKGGASLSTAAGTTTASFVPTAAQWRTEKVILKDFCGSNLRNAMIGFESYNDFGNNIYVDGISIRGFNSKNRNAVLQSINRPAAALCSNAITPEVTFRNDGLDTIRNLTISYNIDNGTNTSYNWTGALAKCEAVTLTLPTTNTTVGNHTLNVSLSNPNGLTDEETSNDNGSKQLSVFEAADMPLIEGFEGLDTISVARSNWGIQNVTGGTTWKVSRKAARNGTQALMINNPNVVNSNNALDYFISPIAKNSASYDSVFVDFDLSYRSGPQYPGSTVFPLDTLEILATFDCGATFTSIWKKFGNELQTVNDPSYSFVSEFTPAIANEWKHIRVYLTPYVNSSNFQLYFVTKGNKQNNIWLDNINISGLKLPQRLKDQGYLIYPNPFNSSFLIHHHAVEAPKDLQGVQVFNAAGQLVWDKRYSGNAPRQIMVDLKQMAKGVYVLKLVYEQKTIVERIVKN